MAGRNGSLCRGKSSPLLNLSSILFKPRLFHASLNIAVCGSSDLVEHTFRQDYRLQSPSDNIIGGLRRLLTPHTLGLVIVDVNSSLLLSQVNNIIATLLPHI